VPSTPSYIQFSLLVSVSPSQLFASQFLLALLSPPRHQHQSFHFTSEAHSSFPYSHPCTFTLFTFSSRWARTSSRTVSRLPIFPANRASQQLHRLLSLPHLSRSTFTLHSQCWSLPNSRFALPVMSPIQLATTTTNCHRT
jgi:hypothetical protein